MQAKYIYPEFIQKYIDFILESENNIQHHTNVVCYLFSICTWVFANYYGYTVTKYAATNKTVQYIITK